MCIYVSLIFVSRDTLFAYQFFLFSAQLKEFQQKSSPASVGGEKVSGGGGVGAKKKRKVKGLSQNDASTTDRNSPDNVSSSFSFCWLAHHPVLHWSNNKQLSYSV